jgi:hypothetical protein
MARYACLAVSCGRAQRFEGIDMTQDPRESYYQDFSPPIHIGHRAHLTPKNVPFDHGDTSRGTFPHRRRSGDPMINCDRIAQALIDYDPDAQEAKVKKAEDQRVQLLDRFPKDGWPEMTLDRYALGQPSALHRSPAR